MRTSVIFVLILVVYCVLAEANSASKPTTIGIPNLLEDEAAKYNVIIHQTGSSEDFLPHQKDRLMPVMLNGERYLCNIPMVIAGEGEGKQTKLNLANKEEALNRIFQLDNICYYRFTGWWIYELCVNKHVRQFHQEQGKGTTMEFHLGYLDKPNAAKWEQVNINTRKETMRSSYSLHINENNPEESYASVTYKDGTICDLTKEHRRTEVRFYCPTEDKIALVAKQRLQQDPSAQASQSVHFMDGIEEPSSCTYVLKFATVGLCDVAGFVKGESQVTKIKCLPMEDKDEERVEIVKSSKPKEEVNVAPAATDTKSTMEEKKEEAATETRQQVIVEPTGSMNIKNLAQEEKEQTKQQQKQ